MFKSTSMKLRSSKVGDMSTTTLDQAVDRAEESYHTFREKLKSLISTLKSHHEVMLKMNSSQMQATTTICDLLINTPISKCVIGTDHYSKNEEENSSIEPDEYNRENEAKTDSISSKEEFNRPRVTFSSANESARKSEDTPRRGAGAHSFHSVIGNGKNLDDLEESFMGLFNASNDLNMVYTKRYMDWIIGYLEEWDKIVSTRIEGRLIEYNKLRKSYAHYTEKVQGLHEKVDRKHLKKSPGRSPRLESKLDRNRLKLSGAEEAHNDFGRSLLSLIEEVTMHYWKDLVPLLHMVIQFNINHSSDAATIMAKLKKTDEILKDISEQHGTSVAGRLEELKPEPIPESIKIQEVPGNESIPEVTQENYEAMEEVKEEDVSSAGESRGLESV